MAAKVKDAEAEVAVLVQFSSPESAVATAAAAEVVQFSSPELTAVVVAVTVVIPTRRNRYGLYCEKWMIFL